MIFSDIPTVGFCTTPLPQGDEYSYTLTTLLGFFLRDLEALYGVRDRSYNLLGIEFRQDGPMIWYLRDCKDVVVMLSTGVASYPNNAIFELAHEAVHLLSPAGSRHAPVVEEGLATRFSIEQTQQCGGVQGIVTAKYANAAMLVGEAETIAPGFIHSIRIRIPAFTEWTPEVFLEIAPTIPESLVEQLLAPFY